MYLCTYSIPICTFYGLFDYIHAFHFTVMSTSVTTPYLYSLSVLYSHSLMKLAV